MENSSGWTGVAESELVKGSEAWIAKRNEKLAAWEASKNALDRAKADEMEARKAFVAFASDEDKREGTERLALANGYEAKVVKKLNFTFKSPNPELSVADAVDAALSKLEALGDEGRFVAQRLVKWTPDLSVSEYRKLDERFKAIIDEVIETKDAAPSLEIVAPKGTPK